jgi:hypothetical protein
MNSDDMRRLADKQEAMAALLERLTVSVEHHVARTDALEDMLGRFRGELAPIKKYVERTRGAMWALGVIVAALLAAKSLGLF